MNSKLWTKAFIINTVANLLIYSVYYLLLVITASHAMNVLKAPASSAGLAAGIFILGAMAARLICGRVIEQAGYKKMLFIGLFIYLFTSLLYFTATSIQILFIVRLLHGFGFGMSSTATGTIAAKLIPPAQYGEGIGYYGLSTTLASAFGPLIGIYLSQNSGFNVILISCSMITVVCIIISCFINTQNISAVGRLNISKPAAGISIYDFIEKKALPISFICFLLVCSYVSVMTFLPNFADATGNRDIVEACSMFFLVYSSCLLISRLTTGKLFDKYGENFLVYPSILLFAVGLLILSRTDSVTALFVSAAFIGFGYGTFFSSANAIAIKVCPPNRIHLAVSTCYAITDLSAGIAPFLLGLIIPFTGFRGLYLVTAVFTAICLFAYYAVHGRNQARHV